MLIFDNTTRKLELLLAGAITTNQLPFVASWVDITTTTFTPGSTVGNSNSTTAVTIAAAPAASTQRQLKFLSIYNADTVAATVTVRYNDNGTTYKLQVTTLQVGDTLSFVDSEGWKVISSTGQLRTTLFIPRQYNSSATANPTFTNSVNPTRKMCGLAVLITPAGSGIVPVVISGQMYNDTSAKGMAAQLRMGTGAAPANGDAASGTVLSNEIYIPSMTTNIRLPFALTGINSGMTIGTTYWIDIAQSVISGGNGALEYITVSAFEL